MLCARLALHSWGFDANRGLNIYMDYVSTVVEKTSFAVLQTERNIKILHRKKCFIIFCDFLVTRTLV